MARKDNYYEQSYLKKSSEENISYRRYRGIGIGLVRNAYQDSKYGLVMTYSEGENVCPNEISSFSFFALNNSGNKWNEVVRGMIICEGIIVDKVNITVPIDICDFNSQLEKFTSKCKEAGIIIPDELPLLINIIMNGWKHCSPPALSIEFNEFCPNTKG